MSNNSNIMKKENKFRVWDELTHKMIYENFVILPNGNIKFPENGWDLEVESEDPPKVILITHIGVKDQKDNDIYNGDIVSFNRKTILNSFAEPVLATIFYDKKQARFWIKDTSIDTKFFKMDELKKAEIIGNIYENPEHKA